MVDKSSLFAGSKSGVWDPEGQTEVIRVAGMEGHGTQSSISSPTNMEVSPYINNWDNHLSVSKLYSSCVYIDNLDKKGIFFLHWNTLMCKDSEIVSDKVI